MSTLGRRTETFSDEKGVAMFPDKLKRLMADHDRKNFLLVSALVVLLVVGVVWFLRS